MARRYWAKIGRRKVYGDTLHQVRAFAQQMADQLGRAVQTGYDEIRSAAGGRARPKRRTMRANPDPGLYVDVWAHQERARLDRKRHMEATKAKRLAKGLRRRGGTVYEAEAAKAKTARFVVTARNRKEAFTLYRPTRTAAEALGSQFEAAGYHVSIQPA